MKRIGMISAMAAAVAVGTAGSASAVDTWTGEPFPERPGKASYVTTVSSADGATWAFGSYSNPGAPTSITAQAYQRDDAGGWHEEQVPNIGTVVASAATGPGNVFAVSSFNKVSAGGTMHFDGTKWTEIPVEVPGASRVSPTDVTAVGPDVWTIGKAYLDGNDPKEFSFAKRWDGAGWQDVPLPPAANELSFSSINGTSSNDLWMAGSTTGRPQQIVALHRDGTQWTQTPVPPLDVPVSDYLTVHDVAAFAPDDVWLSATQTNYDDQNQKKRILLHWNGTAWSAQQPPVAEGGLGKIVRAEGALWILAEKALLRYDGGSWQTVDGPPEGALGNGAELPDGRLVATGSHGDGITPQPFATVHGH